MVGELIGPEGYLRQVRQGAQAAQCLIVLRVGRPTGAPRLTVWRLLMEPIQPVTPHLQ